jgi:hypothetical protein
VQPILELLGKHNEIKYLYDRVHTKPELIHLLKKWSQKGYSDFGIGYLAFHGSPGTIHLARDSMTLAELAETLKGKLTGRVVHFGSCQVFRVPRSELERFRKKTGAKAITGYRDDVDWMQSAAFDLLFFDAFSYYSRMDYVIRDVNQQAMGLGKRLKFTVVSASSNTS